MKDRLQELASAIAAKFHGHRAANVFTVAISGIDAAGKGYISERLYEELEARGYRVALIHTDPWQNPIPVRLSKENPAENVYEHIFRWNDLFEQLIFPLQKNGNICLEIQAIRSDADIYYPLVYDHSNIDILLIEGILLFKKEYLPYYDHKIWIDCSFETGLQRALTRNIENLGEKELIHDYDTYYYAAQRLHLERDDPAGSADVIFDNNECYASTCS